MADHEYRITLCTDEPLTEKEKKVITALLLAFDWSFSADRIVPVPPPTPPEMPRTHYIARRSMRCPFTGNQEVITAGYAYEKVAEQTIIDNQGGRRCFGANWWFCFEPASLEFAKC